MLLLPKDLGPNSAFPLATGATLFETSIPAYGMVNMLLPADGIPFPKGVYVSTLTNVATVTLLTSKYSGPGLTPSKDYFPNCKLGGVIKNLKPRDRRDMNRCDSTRHNM